MATDITNGSDTRSIACVGLEADTENALHSIVNVLAGRSRCAWRFAPPAQAQVLVVGHLGGRPRVPVPVSPATIVVAVTDGDDRRPSTRFHLTHPFRVMPVLTLLDELFDALAPLQGPVRAESRTVTPPPPAPNLVAALRALAKQTHAPGRFLVSHSRERERLWITHDGGMYACDDAVRARLRAGEARFAAPVFANDAPPSTLTWRPASELRWFDAMHAGTAPVASGTARYSLSAWPDFGVLGAARWQLQAVAAMTRGPVALSDLVRRSGQTLATIASFLAACEAVDLLVVSAPTSAVVAQARRETPGFMASLLVGLRARLGFERAR